MAVGLLWIFYMGMDTSLDPGRSSDHHLCVGLFRELVLLPQI